jgi:hypothetical protein
MFRSLLAITLPAVLLLGQGGPGAERPRMDPGDPPDRARIFERLHELRTSRIQASLGVSVSTAKGIADKWGQFDRDSHSRRQNLREARQAIQDILLVPGTEEEKNARIGPALAQFAAAQRQQRDAKEKFEGEIQRMLSPVQQGRFLILMEEFQRRLNEAVGPLRRDRL